MKKILPSLAGYPHKRSALEMIFRHEVTLIAEEYHRLYRSSPADAEALKEREMKELWAWRDYIEWKLSCESGGISRRELREPESECMPRTRRRWVEVLGQTIDYRDPFVDFMIGFMVGFIFSMLAGRPFDVVARRDELVMEMSRRLKPARERDGDGVTPERERKKLRP